MEKEDLCSQLPDECCNCKASDYAVCAECDEVPDFAKKDSLKQKLEEVSAQLQKKISDDDDVDGTIRHSGY